MWLPFLVIGVCFLETSAFRVHRLKNPENCQERTKHFNKYIVLSGEPAVLKCPSFQYLTLDISEISELSLDLVWSKNDPKSLYLGEESRIQPAEDLLWFFPARTEDSGMYTCILRNSSFCVEIELSFTVVEETEVSLTDIAYEQNAFEKENYQMFCPNLSEFIIKYTEVEIRWNKDGQALPKHNDKYTYLDGKTYLEINDIQSADEGYYTCQLSFIHENSEYTISRIINLRTLAQPKTYHPVIVSLKSKAIAAAIGSKLVIPCKVFTGYGDSSVTLVYWLANDSYIDEYFTDGRVMEGEFRKASENGANYIEIPLNFEKVMEDDFMTEFKCIAKNEHGTQILPTQIRNSASSFNWYYAAVPAFLLSLIVLIIVIYKCRQSEYKKDYTLTKS
ncbi:interleukin-1 receptor type 2-like [Discoglossus pictus]